MAVGPKEPRRGMGSETTSLRQGLIMPAPVGFCNPDKRRNLGDKDSGRFAISLALRHHRRPVLHFHTDLAVGLVFSTQGFLKYVDPDLGVNRFTKIGFPYPDFTAHFVGAFEMVCGLLVLVGLWTRAAAIPILIVNLTAIASTKIPELWASGQGFWYMVTDIRTDFAMLLSLLYLFAAGSGRYTVQEVARRRARRQ